MIKKTIVREEFALHVLVFQFFFDLCAHLSRCPPFLGALSFFCALLYLSPTLLGGQLFLVPTLATKHLCSVPLSLLTKLVSTLLLNAPLCSVPTFVHRPHIKFLFLVLNINVK